MFKLILQPHRKYRLLLLLGDYLILIASLSIILCFDDVCGARTLSWSLSRIYAVHLAIPAVTLFFFYVLELYDLSTPRSLEIMFFHICIGTCMSGAFYSILSYFIISLRPGKINLLIFVSTAIIATFLLRVFFKRMSSIRPARILLVGNERIFDEIHDILEKKYTRYYTIVDQWKETANGLNRMDLSDYLKEVNIDIVVFSLRSKLVMDISDTLISFNFKRKSVIDAYNFYQRLTYKCPLYFLDNFAMLLNANKEIFIPTIAANMKRAIDLLCVFLLSPVALPLFLVSALAIKLDSKGPVLFTQERLGQNEEPFRLYKLRTMIHDAESRTGPKWSTDTDPRVTRAGRILRKLRLDELPQLFNVLKGEMSIVGPRPIRKHFADILANEIPFYRLRFLAKPGLTGWAQVHYDYAGSNEGQSEKQEYDLFYLIHRSISLDLYILFRTVRVMVWGKGT